MGRQPSRLAKWGLWIAVAALVVLAVCVIGNRTELIHFGIAVRGLALAAALGLVGVVVSAAGIIRTMTSNRSGARLAIAGLVLGLLVAAPVVQVEGILPTVYLAPLQPKQKQKQKQKQKS